MLRTAQLYLHTEEGITGPFPAERLHEMVKGGRISAETPVSPDGVKWLFARQIRGLFVAQESAANVPVPATRPELRRILSQVEKHIRSLPLFFNLAVSAGVLVTMFATFSAIFWGTQPFAGSLAPWLIALAAAVPTLLLGAAAGQAAGNYALRVLTELAPAERLCLALHLPRIRAPRHWPIYLRNWVYGGDWLVDSTSCEFLPYVRAFISGSPPASMEEELEIWRQLLQTTGGDAKKRLEVGRSVRELACLEHLPAWSRDLTPGTSLVDLESQMGRAAREWAACLLRRAGTRLPEFAQVDLDGSLDEIKFEFHSCLLRDGREGLLVVIRPRHQASSLFARARAA